MRNKAKALLPWLVLVVALGTFTYLAVAEPLDTYHQGWNLVRETAAEDGANFAAVYNLSSNGGDFASKDSATVLLGGPFRIVSRSPSVGYGVATSPGSRWQFIISGGVEDNDTFSMNVVGWSKTNGPLQVICEGAGVIGTQDVVLHPHDGSSATGRWYADTITLDEVTKWPKAQGDLAGVNVYNSGDNEIAILEVQTQGIEYIQFIFYDAAGGGTEATNITVYGRRY